MIADRSPDESGPGKYQTSTPLVVGIGASAGGLEALQAFFGTVQSELGIAYVVIMHLAPDHDSELPAILGRETTMPVTEVGDAVKVKLEPNHVFVIGPDRTLEITPSTISAKRFRQPRGRRAAIDNFFQSLAAMQDSGVAMILSGSGTDGVAGAKAVKEAGGFIMVQHPGEAGHNSMPMAVISAGLADVVLPVRELAGELSRFVENRKQLAARVFDAVTETSGEGQETAIAQILKLLHKRTGHDFKRYKRNTVIRRLMRRMQLTHQASIEAYLDYLQQHSAETRLLLNDLLITVTSFFRDPDAWKTLKSKVIKPIFDRISKDEKVRIWVTGCATGEEAYGLAILCNEEMGRRGLQRELTVFASDIDEDALAVAREGRYPKSVVAELPEHYLQAYFHADGGYYRISSETRDCLVFANHNLLRDPPFSNLHLISCRNLLIYLDRELQERAIALFRYACRPGGYLFLGSSETADNHLFQPIDKHHRIYRAKPYPAATRIPLPEFPSSAPALPASRPRPRGERTPATAVHLEALERCAPPSLVVDEYERVIHLSKSAGRYLQPAGGSFSSAVTELARPELRNDLRLGLRRALQDQQSYLSHFVPVAFNGDSRHVAIMIQPTRAKDTEAMLALVVFLEADGASGEPARTVNERDGELVHALQEKLRHTEHYLEDMREQALTSKDELRVAHEELQSLNEEYRSTTEELETSKEELQSINEELLTVNQELKTKLDEISRAHSDMENFMSAADIATVFLDRELCINRFTPQAKELFNIELQDLGRYIGDFRRSFQYDGLERDAKRVLDSLSRLEQQVTTDSGGGLIVRLRPYQTAAAAVGGVVITCVDVTSLKQAERQLRRRTAELEQSQEALSKKTSQLLRQDQRKEDFLNMLGHELRNPLAAIQNNIGLCQLTVQRRDPEDQADEPLSRSLAAIDRQSRHMTRLVDDLLDMTRLKRNRMRLQRREIELRALIEETASEMKPALTSGRLRLEMELPDKEINVYADPERLKQVLENLLSNAIAFTDPKGHIEIEAQQQGEWVWIAVRDSGIGIDPTDLESIFEPYRQLDVSRSNNRNGLGLGLPLAKRLVELHGGAIQAYSKGQGTGSEFKISLPLGQPKAASIEQSTWPEQVSHKVLVVDDDNDVSEAFAGMLSGMGHEAAAASNGDEALRIAEEFRPDLVFVDLSMPGMDGRELARRLRERFKPETMTLVMLSGFAVEAEEFDHRIVKPATIEKITDLISRLPSPDRSLTDVT